MSHRSQVALHFILIDYWLGFFKSYKTIDKHEITPSEHTYSAPVPGKANATFVFLCRNDDLPGVVTSIQQMEDRFNRRCKYPWVLLNDEPFTEDFKK